MGKIYASSDWHGCLDPAIKLLSSIKKDDKLYYLGDSIDRGSDGLALFNLLTEDPRVTYLLGNHEELMRLALRGIIKGQYGYDYNLWIANGGDLTFKAIDENNFNKEISTIINKIEKMPFYAEYHSPKGHKVILEHAGFSLGISHRSHDPLWDRDHFYDEWSDDPEDQNTYIVHGHTPVQYLQFHYGYIDAPTKNKEDMVLKYAWEDNPGDWRPQIIKYCNGHKIDIDLCTIVSDRIALLDLNTFEVQYFEGEPKK